MNCKLLIWGISLSLLALTAPGALIQNYEFAAVSNSVTAGANLSAVANNGNSFVCVGASDSPVLSVNTNNFAAFALNNNGGGYLLFSNAWTNTLKSPLKYTWLNCVTVQPNGFVAAGASNAVLVSSDGVNWTNWGHILAAGEQAYSADGIAYNAVSGTYGAALAVYEASWTTNPISTNVWQVAALQTESFAESFRGVTTFGTSDMALCGIFGDIRISTNGGQNWNLSQQINLSYPNLLAITSDGGSNLVSSGNYSMLELSTNGGPNASSWIFQTNINIGVSATSTNFNSLAYNSEANQFLAAGSIGANGLIVTAPKSFGTDQYTWTRQTNLFQYQNGVLVPLTSIASALNGVTVANSNLFQGVTMFVGDSGTVMIGGYAPPEPDNSLSIDFTNLLSSPPTNAVLAATIIAGVNPVGDLTVDWYALPTGGTPLALNAIGYQPTNASCGTYTNYAAERDLRTGFTSTSRTPFIFTIIPGAPSNPVSATNCDDGNGQFGMCEPTPLSVTVVTNAANPPGAIQVNWYDANSNLVSAGAFSNNSDVVTFTPTNLAPGVYTFYAQATNPASGFASESWATLTFQLNPLPQWASLTGLSTNALLSNPQINPAIAAPGIANMLQITTVEPAATIAFDWYTNSDPTVSTYENPNKPLVATGATFAPTNQICGTYIYYVRARVVDPNFSGCICQSSNLIAVTFTLLPPPPVDSIVNVTNVLNGFSQVNIPIWVDLVTNAANPASSFKVNWFSTAQGTGNLNDGTDTNLNNRFFHTPTGGQCDVYTNWAETEALNTSSGSPAVNTNLFPVVYVIIPANPTAVGVTDVTNCVEIPAPTFTVIVTNGQNANWYTVPSGGSPVAANTTSFTPTNTSAGTWTFSAVAVDPPSGLASTGAIQTTLSLYDCTNSPTINLNPANGTGTIQWPGNLTLLSTTNLTPPIVWSTVATGTVFSASGNSLTFTNTNPPIQFFRLTN